MRTYPSIHSYLPKAIATALTGGVMLLSGCGLGTVATDITPAAPVSGIEISGVAHGGATAISGATVKLWVSGLTGYGQGATVIATATTATGTGKFTLSPTFTTSECSSPTNQGLYITVAGGDPTGNTTTNVNSAILLVDDLGQCSALNSSITIQVNEATTVAAAYALGNFSTISGTSVNIGAPSSNAQGIADASANAIALVNPYNGLINTSTATLLLPTATVASLANTITGCVNATSTTYPCADQTSPAASGLFTLATPPSGTKPTNVYQALINIAKYPGNNVSALLTLGSAYSLFQPTLPTTTTTSSTAPNDLTLGIAIPNSTLAAASTAPAALAIDKTDNVWIVGASTTAGGNIITEVPSPSAIAGGSTVSNNAYTSFASTQNVRWGAFDTTGNLWLSDGAALAVYNGGTSAPTAQSFATLGTGSTAATPATLDANNYVLAIDGSNNVFTATYGAQGNCVPNTVSAATTVCDVVELPAGVAANATDTFGGNYITAPSVRGMFADASTNAADKGNLWITDYGVLSATKGATTTPGNMVQVLTPSTGTQNLVTVGPTGAGLWGIALDNSSSAYVVASTIPALYYVPQGSTTAVTSSVTANTLAGVPTATSAPSSGTINGGVTGGFLTPSNVAVDGAGNVFIANVGYASIVEYSPSLSAYVSPYFGYSPSLPVSASTASITKYAVASGVITFTAANTFVPGETVTVSGFTGANAPLNATYTVLASGLKASAFTASYSGTLTGATATGTATGTTTAQSTFNCTSTACTPGPSAITVSNTGIAIDRAGSVWTVDGHGTALEIIGTAAPTDPVLADGKYGVTP